MGIEADRELEAAKARVPGGPVFWTGVLMGWGAIAFGVVGALNISSDTHPRSLAIWLVGSLLVHDLAIAPAVFVIGRVLRRKVADRFRAALQAVLYLSAVLVVVSIPVIGRFGARRDNPTLLPRDATTGLIVALALIWIGAALLFLVARLRSRPAAHG
jgi:hypothetical protein